MSADDGDDSWEDWNEVAETKADGVPELAPAADTSKHRTLQGYVDEEIRVARARIEEAQRQPRLDAQQEAVRLARLDERRFWLTAFTLFQMAHKVHVLAAQEVTTKVERWASEPENARLIRVTMDGA